MIASVFKAARDGFEGIAFVGHKSGMTPSRFAVLALFLSVSPSLWACDKPPATEAPTTGAPITTADDGGATTPPDSSADGAGGDDAAAGGECRPTGCSGIVCSDADVITTCEFRPEYACYKDAACTRQSDGACGWTKSPELDACLANPPKE